MTKVVVADLDPRGRLRRARDAKLTTRRVRDESGKLSTRYVLDTESPDFDDQFLKVFQLNVTRARRETARRKLIAEE